MVFQRTRIHKKTGRSYTYWEERYRENGKVKSRHLGKSPRRWYQPIPDEERGLRYIDQLIEKYPGDPFATKAAEIEAARAAVSKELGVDLSPSAVPIEKVSPAEKSPSPETAPDAAPSAPGDKSE